MSIRATASTLIVTALALVGDYSAIQQPSSASFVHESPSRQPRVKDLRSTIHELTKGWLELDQIYSDVVKNAYASDSFDEERYGRNIELLSAVRALETTLKTASVPLDLVNDHTALRRAIAKTRSRLAMLDNFYRQFFVSYEEFESSLSADGLKALADHTTKRLGEIA
jgi:hypothetical protein